MGVGNLDDRILFEQGFHVSFEAHLQVALRIKRRVSGYGDTKRLGELQQRFLGQIRLSFNLQNLGFDASICEDVYEQSTGDVAEYDKVNKWPKMRFCTAGGSGKSPGIPRCVSPPGPSEG